MSSLATSRPSNVWRSSSRAPDKNWERFVANTNKLVEWIEKSDFRQELELLVNRYSSALHQSDLHVAFLLLWGILEKLTDTVGGSYETTIDRACRPFQEGKIAKQTLQQLQRRRNDFVHSGGKTAESQMLCYVMKYYVDYHLLSAIRNDYGVQSLEEHGRFLSLPTNRKSLEKLLSWYKLAIQRLDEDRDFDGSGILGERLLCLVLGRLELTADLPLCGSIADCWPILTIDKTHSRPQSWVWRRQRSASSPLRVAQPEQTCNLHVDVVRCSLAGFRRRP